MGAFEMGEIAVSETKKASDVFIDCLEAEGCEYVFGVPGEENLDLLDSLGRSDKIKLILTRHEQGAGFMAATYGRHTGKTGVCLATLGPGMAAHGRCTCQPDSGPQGGVGISSSWTMRRTSLCCSEVAAVRR